LRLAADATRAYFIANGMAKESGNYDELLSRLEKTGDVSVDLK